MNNKTFVTLITLVVSFLLYLRFGSLAFWVIAVTGFLSALFAMIVETFLHVTLKEDSFQNYRRFKRRIFKGPCFDFNSSEFCQKHKTSEIKFLVIMVLFFIGIISLIYAII